MKGKFVQQSKIDLKRNEMVRAFVYYLLCKFNFDLLNRLNFVLTTFDPYVYLRIIVSLGQAEALHEHLHNMTYVFTVDPAPELLHAFLTLSRP